MAAGEVFVTGAGGALGGGVVRALRARSVPTVAVDRTGSEARLAELYGNDPGCRRVCFDVTQAEQWRAALGDGPAAGAVLVAGGYAGGRRFFEAGAESAWPAMFEANLETARVSLQALLPGMVQAGRGAVVVIGSRAALHPEESAGAAAYAASKAALVALVRTLAAELLAHGVRINAVLPSTIDTPANRAAMPRADASSWVSIESLAGVIDFLLSDGARDISGALLPVYGRVGV